MIRLEDAELEQAVLSGDSCIAVPIEIYIPQNGEPQITVYSCFEQLAREFENKFDGMLLTADALNWLNDRLYTNVKTFGYNHFEDDIHMLCEYSVDDSRQLYRSDVDDVRIIDSEDELVGIDISLVDDIYIDGNATVVIRDNKLVSIACANDVSFEDNSIELFVETHPDYRNLGLGAATVTKLSDYYIKKGRIVRYKCAKNNAASIYLANKCGFEKNGERYSYVCYANEEKLSNDDI